MGKRPGRPRKDARNKILKERVHAAARGGATLEVAFAKVAEDYAGLSESGVKSAYYSGPKRPDKVRSINQQLADALAKIAAQRQKAFADAWAEIFKTK